MDPFTAAAQMYNDLVKVALHSLIGYGGRAVWIQKPDVVEDRLDLFRLTVMALQLPMGLLTVNINAGNDPAGSGGVRAGFFAPNQGKFCQAKQKNYQFFQSFHHLLYLDLACAKCFVNMPANSVRAIVFVKICATMFS